MSPTEAERGRRYLVDGDAQSALGTCEAALREASAPDALSLRLLAARAAQSLGDLTAELRHLEGAEALVREGGLETLGPVLRQLGELHLRRNEPARAAVALAEALEHLPADDPLRDRAEAALDEARQREADDDDETEPPPPSEEEDPTEALAQTADSDAAERLLAMTDRLLDGDPDMDLSAVLDVVLAELVEAVGADRGFVLLQEPGEGIVIRSARDARGFPVLDPAKQVSRKIAERATAESIALRAMRPAEDPRFAGSRSAKALDLCAVVAAPLRYRRIDLGCVVLDRRATNVIPFSDAAEALVARFAKLASGVIVRARRRDAQKRRNDALQDLFSVGTSQVKERTGIKGFVGESEGVFHLLRLVERIAPTDARVLIRGESGTGKELIARTIHDNSPRSNKPYHTVNCAALAESLLEDELFGHVKGAFSGADKDRAGLFELADCGTLFLDEIGDATPRLQAELLRVLQEGEVRRLGAGKVKKVNVRVVAATHQDLEAMVSEGRFREDLFYRLNVVELRIPPLRERREDIPLLATHFAKEARAKVPDPAQAGSLTETLLAELQQRDWPGNIRELKNVVTRYIMVGELSTSGPKTRAKSAALAPLHEPLPPGPEDALTLREVERRAIVAALRHTGGSKKETAKVLGIGRRTLYNKLKAHGLE